MKFKYNKKEHSRIHKLLKLKLNNKRKRHMIKLKMISDMLAKQH